MRGRGVAGDGGLLLTVNQCCGTHVFCVFLQGLFVFSSSGKSPGGGGVSVHRCQVHGRGQPSAAAAARGGPRRCLGMCGVCVTKLFGCIYNVMRVCVCMHRCLCIYVCIHALRLHHCNTHTHNDTTTHIRLHDAFTVMYTVRSIVLDVYTI